MVHFGSNSWLVALHHAVGVLSCVGAECAGWRGLNVTLAMVYELGSFCLNWGDCALPGETDTGFRGFT